MRRFRRTFDKSGDRWCPGIEAPGGAENLEDRPDVHRKGVSILGSWIDVEVLEERLPTREDEGRWLGIANR